MNVRCRTLECFDYPCRVTRQYCIICRMYEEAQKDIQHMQRLRWIGQTRVAQLVELERG